MTSTRRWVVIGISALSCWFAAPPESRAEPRLLECSSTGYKYQYCEANTQGRVVLLREMSTGNLCRQGRGWGFDTNGIWVDRGCRGAFSYGRDDGGGGWDRPGALTCESIGYRYRYCNANTRNRVSLTREISTGNLCREGRGWGYDNGGIWVDRGCRGEFRYGEDNRKRKDAAIAAGIIGAFALGAAISSSQNREPSPPPSPRPSTGVPEWAIGSFQAWDPEAGDIVQLIVANNGDVVLRDERGSVVNQGALRDGMVHWRDGKKSWLARESVGVMIGEVDSGKHFYFRRSS